MTNGIGKTYHIGNSDFCTSCGELNALLDLHELTGQCPACWEKQRPIEYDECNRPVLNAYWIILVSEWVPELATRWNEDGTPIDGYSFVVHTQMGGTRKDVEREAVRIRSILRKAVMIAGPICDTLEDVHDGQYDLHVWHYHAEQQHKLRFALGDD